MRLLWFTSAAVLALVAGGCGESKPTLAPVRGHVYFHGVPLAGGAIVFTPDPDRGGHGPLACARIGADGAYVLVTGPDPGAVVGWHRVTLQARVPDAPAETRLPPRYTDPEQSGQSCEVKAGESNVIDFHLE